jgi:hypothetical protein
MEDLFGKAELKQGFTKQDPENLPGTGKPVKVERFYFMPPEFRFAYTVLKNSGHFDPIEEKTLKQKMPKKNYQNINLSYYGLLNLIENLLKLR